MRPCLKITIQNIEPKPRAKIISVKAGIASVGWLSLTQNPHLVQNSELVLLDLGKLQGEWMAMFGRWFNSVFLPQVPLEIHLWESWRQFSMKYKKTFQTLGSSRHGYRDDCTDSELSAFAFCLCPLAHFQYLASFICACVYYSICVQIRGKFGQIFHHAHPRIHQAIGLAASTFAHWLA